MCREGERKGEREKGRREERGEREGEGERIMNNYDGKMTVFWANWNYRRAISHKKSSGNNPYFYFIL